MSAQSITIDAELSVPVYSPVCTYCIHAFRHGRKCSAFDGPIPLEIWLGEHAHRTPYPGDRGIRFDWAADVAPAVRAEVERKLANRSPGEK